jgi:integrase
MWYATLGGKQSPLYVTDPNDQAAAWAALQRLLPGVGPPPAPAKTVADVVAGFLADAAGRLKPTTMKAYRWYANRFAADFPDTLAPMVTPDAMERAARRSGWSKSSRHNYLATCETILRWAGVRPGRVKKPPKESAGAASVIPEDVFRRALHHFCGDWHAAVVFLWNTGARPSEAASVTVENKIGRRITAYGIRHTFCTRALAGGESDTIVAGLVGHSSTDMIHKHYRHYSAMGRELKEAAARIGKAG